MTAPLRTPNLSRSSWTGDLRATLALFGAKGWTIAIAGSVLTALLIGIPAAIIDTPLFGRKVGVEPVDYAVWLAASLLGGLIIATFSIPQEVPREETRAVAGGFLSYIAVGCPVCNKAAVAVLGTSGALNVFGPAQVYIGIASLALLGWALVLRGRAIAGACEVR